MKKLKTHIIDWAQIDRFLAGADKKLASARKILAFDEEACLQQAYEAMLKASLGFMFSHGFRARSQPGHHIAIIEFVRQRIDRKHAGLLTVLDRLRRKRNQALYDDMGFVFLTTTLNEPSKQPATTWRSFERTSPREIMTDISHAQRTCLNCCLASLFSCASLETGALCQQRTLELRRAVPASRPRRNIFIFPRHIFLSKH